MYWRLTLLFLASGALYALLGTRSEIAAADRFLSNWHQAELFEASLEFMAIWLPLVVMYAVAVRLVSQRGGSGLYTTIFVTSGLFRAALFLGDGFHDAELPVFLHGDSPISMISGSERLVAAIADLGSLALAPSVLRAAGLPVGAALIHGWNPLVIKEVAGSGRIEALALFLLMIALRLAQSGRFRGAASIAYGASLSGPLFFLASLPAVGRVLRPFVLISIVIAFVGWSFSFPGASWESLSGWPPESYVGGSMTPSVVALAGLLLTRNELAIIVGVLAVWLAVTSYRSAHPSGDERHLPRDTLLAMGGWLFVAPQVLPWAFVAVAYLAPHTRNRGWLVFTATAPLTYLALDGMEWSFWLGFSQYFVAYAALTFFWLGSPPSK